VNFHHPTPPSYSGFAVRTTKVVAPVTSPENTPAMMSTGNSLAAAAAVAVARMSEVDTELAERMFAVVVDTGVVAVEVAGSWAVVAGARRRSRTAEGIVAVVVAVAVEVVAGIGRVAVVAVAVVVDIVVAVVVVVDTEAVVPAPADSVDTGRVELVVGSLPPAVTMTGNHTPECWKNRVR
jgi:hypothetical protein